MNVAADISELKTNMEQGVETLTDFADHATSTIAVGTLLGNALTGAFETALAGLTDLVEAMPDLVAHTIDLGNSMFEMSMKTGASVENLSALRYVAAQSGMDFETLNTSFFKVETALGATGAKADTLSTSLSNVGLSMAELKNERPDEAFIEIVSALENVGNAADRNALAMQLFGRGAKDMAGLFHEDIYAMMQDAQDLGLVMSTSDAAAAHAASVGWQSFTMQLEAVGMSIANAVMPGLIAVEGLLSGAFTAAVDSGALSFSGLDVIVKTTIDTLLSLAESGVNAAKTIYDVFVDLSPAFELVGKGVLDLGVIFLNLIGTVTDLASHLPGVGDAFNGMTTVIDMAKNGFNSARDHLDGLSGSLQSGKAAADSYFDGVMAGIETMRAKLPAAYDEALAKIAEFVAKSKAAGDTIASSLSPDPKLLANQLATTEKLYDEYYKAVDAGSHDHVASQINDVWLAADAQIAALEKSKSIAIVDYDIIWSKAEQLANNIIQKNLESDKYTKEHYQLIADQAEAAYNFAQAHSDSYTSQEMRNLNDVYQAAERASNHWAQSASDDMAKAAKSTQTMVTAVSALVSQVETLAGQWISAADAKKKFDQGNSVDVTALNLQQQLSQTYTGEMFTQAGIKTAGDLGGDYQYATTLATQGYSFAEIVAALEGGQLPKTPIGPRIPGFESGGPTVAGLAMLHDGEYVVPKGGALVSGGGGGDTYNINVNGAFGTMQQVTDAVKAGIAQTGRKYSRANRT